MQGPSAFTNITANTVVAFGPSGTVVGVFVYAPGTTPALGNLPVDWMTEGTHDPYGNVLPFSGTVSKIGNAIAALTNGSVQVGNVTFNQQGLIDATLQGGSSTQMVIQSAKLLNTDNQANIVLISNPTGTPAEITFGASGTLFLFNGPVKVIGNAEFDTSWTMPTGDAAESIPMKAFQTVSGSGGTRVLLAQLRSPQVTGGPAGMLAGINFDSQSVDLTTTPAELILFAQDGTHTTAITITPTFVTIGGQVSATGGTAAFPTIISTDTWQTPTLLNSWTNLTNRTLRYRMQPNQTVALDGRVTIPAGVTNPSVVFNLPAAYRPASRLENVTVIEVPTASPFNAVAHYCEISTTGDVSVFGAMTAGNNISFGNVPFPLDGTP